MEMSFSMTAPQEPEAEPIEPFCSDVLKVLREGEFETQEDQAEAVEAFLTQIPASQLQLINEEREKADATFSLLFQEDLCELALCAMLECGLTLPLLLSSRCLHRAFIWNWETAFEAIISRMDEESLMHASHSLAPLADSLREGNYGAFRLLCGRLPDSAFLWKGDREANLLCLLQSFWPIEIVEELLKRMPEACLWDGKAMRRALVTGREDVTTIYLNIYEKQEKTVVLYMAFLSDLPVKKEKFSSACLSRLLRNCPQPLSESSGFDQFVTFAVAYRADEGYEMMTEFCDVDEVLRRSVGQFVTTIMSNSLFAGAKWMIDNYPRMLLGENGRNCLTNFIVMYRPPSEKTLEFLLFILDSLDSLGLFEEAVQLASCASPESPCPLYQEDPLQASFALHAKVAMWVVEKYPHLLGLQRPCNGDTLLHNLAKKRDLAPLIAAAAAAGPEAKQKRNHRGETARDMLALVEHDEADLATATAILTPAPKRAE